MSNSPEEPPRPTPTVADLLEAVKEVPGSSGVLLRGLGSTGQTDAIEAELAYTHLFGLQDHYGLKKIWAIAIMSLMFVMVVFQCILLGLVGGHEWSFTDYKWLLPALLVQNLAQIAGLAYIVVKALFNASIPLPAATPAKRG